MNSQATKPKFSIDDKVYIVHHAHRTTEHSCDLCVNGNIKLADGEEYRCPKCYGQGKTYTSSHSKIEADEKPRYVTGISFTSKRRGKKGFEERCEYYLMPELNENHSVYEDSVGDERTYEGAVFATYEEAVKGAEIEQARMDNENAKNNR